MNCNLLQRRLLALEDPGRPPTEMQAHLARCGACRAWQRRVLALERAVPLLPVPPSAGRTAFVGRLLAGARAAPPGGPRAVRRETVLRKVALVTALAAGLLMFVIGFWAWQWPTDRPATVVKKPHGDVFLARLLGHDLELARYADPGHRLDSLTGLADALFGQADPLARAGAADDLGALARLHRQVLEDGVLHQGPAVKAAAERERAARQLAEEARRADALAGKVDERCAAPVRDMAAAARKAEEGLRGSASRARAPRAAWDLAAAARPLRRGLLAPAAGALLLVSAAPPVPPADEEVRRFQRNLDLIRRLVRDGLDLAREDDPVKRADRCNDIAQGLARAMTSAEGGESDRVAELGRHLRDVLEKGVAHNLKDARDRIPVGSTDEKRLRKVRDETEEVVSDLETRLGGKGQPPDDVRSALRAIKEACNAVQQALRTPAAGR